MKKWLKNAYIYKEWSPLFFMKLQIKKRSNSLMVVLPKHFIDFYDLQENDWLNVDEDFVQKNSDKEEQK